MFGYIIPDQQAMSAEAKYRYRTAYCGLCRRAAALHGMAGRMTLSYDLTFLNLLLCSLYEGESPAAAERGRCPMHPLRPIDWRYGAPTDYCADIGLVLHYYSARDKWADDRSPVGLGYMKMLEGRRAAAEARWPRQTAAITGGLERLAALEQAGCEDLDLVSGCFGGLMAELFDYKQDRWAGELRAVGGSLGQYIYLLDAWDDLARDKRRGSYNPLKALAAAPDYEEQMRDIFELLLAKAAAAFRRLPCVEDADLLENILYSGIWLKYNVKNARRRPRGG